jgi:hypothetical protein
MTGDFSEYTTFGTTTRRIAQLFPDGWQSGSWDFPNPAETPLRTVVMQS